MSFFAPERLLAFIGVAVLVGAYVMLQARRKAYAVKFTNIALLDRVAPRQPGWRRHVPAAVFLLAFSVLVVGFAEPALPHPTPRERATIILAIDTSLSMQATDVAPSRFEAAKEAAAAFIDIIPPKINVGVVEFNQSAELKVPPTTDHAQLKRGIKALEMDESTAIGEAVYASLAAIAAIPPDEENTPPPARIVLMSDGKTTTGRSEESAAQAAVDAGVPVSTIAFGTDEGYIATPNEPGVKLPVPVDRDALQQLAETTEGQFYEAASEGELRSVYQDIGSSVGYVTELRDISAWIIGIALFLLTVTSALSLAWFSRLP
jgi:Ca-activated chloride channel family protein